MRRTRRGTALAAGACAALCCAGPVSADVVAVAARLSTPPPRTFVIDVANGSVGGLRLNDPAASYVRRLGIPDYIGALESRSKIEMLWSRTTSPRTGWATATLRSAAEATVTQLRFAGTFRTLAGDRHGTDLATFLRHWRLQGPVVTGVVRNGVLVEYNVVVGGVVFAFDQRRKLAAVGLAAPGSERSLCVIPAACVETPLR